MKRGEVYLCPLGRRDGGQERLGAVVVLTRDAINQYAPGVVVAPLVYPWTPRGGARSQRDNHAIDGPCIVAETADTGRRMGQAWPGHAVTGEVRETRGLLEGGSMATDIRARLDAYRRQQRDLAWRGTFDDYFEIATKNPGVAQLAHARVYDMIMHPGVEEGPDGLPCYPFFSRELFGLEKPVAQIV